MLTVNADDHEVMNYFHKPKDEKRSIVVLKEHEYTIWLHADQKEANSLLKLSSDDFLVSKAAPI